MKALTTSGRSLLYMACLIGFFVVLTSTVTMHIFGDCLGEGLQLAQQSRSNFFTFGDALLTNVQMLTGEDWAPIMFAHMHTCGQWVAPVFVFIQILYGFILMNLFTAIILQNFSISEHDKMRHQKAAYREKRGELAIEDDMQILQWLAEAASVDAVASKAIQNAMSSMAKGQDKASRVLRSMCGSCYHDAANAEYADLIKLQAAHLELRTQESKLHVQLTELHERLDDLRAASSASPEFGIKIEHTQARIELVEQDLEDTAAKVSAATIKVNEESERIGIGDDKLKSSKALIDRPDKDAKNKVDYSCCCLQSNHKLRMWCQRVTTSAVFEATILLVILVSSTCLAYKPGTEPGWVDVVSQICTLIFIAEFVMKVIDLNFVRYLSFGWNVLDFAIVCTALMELILTLSKDASDDDLDHLATLKVLRMLRLLRVVRAIKHVQHLKVIVTVLIGCVPTVLAALAIVMIIFICFGIVGLSLFGGLFWRCECSGSVEVFATTCTDMYAEQECNQYFYGQRITSEEDRASYQDPCITASRTGPGVIHGTALDACCADQAKAGEESWWKQECLTQVARHVDVLSNGTITWRNPAYNFDSIGNAVRTLFYMATTEGWVEIMHSGMDIPTRPGLPPVKNLNWPLSLYFVVFQVLGACFSFSLFTGVLVNYFAESSGSGLLTRKQREWVHAKLLVLRAHSISVLPPEAHFRAAAHRLYTWWGWEVIFTCVIALQVMIVVVVMFPRPESQLSGNRAVEFYINLFCLCFFTFEVILGVVALQFRSYIRSKWNQFDVIVVLLSWMAFIAEHTVDTTESMSGGAPLVQVQALRATRIVRILTLFKGSTSVKAIFAALLLSLPGIVNIVLLMLLCFFVFSVLGMHLFAEQPRGEHLNDHENFDDTASGMRLIFEVASGRSFLHTVHEMEDNQLEDGTLMGDPFLYFFFMYIVAVLVLTNLFVAMLLENVTIALTTEKSAIQSQHTDAFKKIWDDYIIDPQIQSKTSSTGKDMLNCYDLIKLIKTLDEPLGRIDELDNWEHRLLLELKVGLQVSRRHTYVSFENALMGICVLYLSNACLPYDLQLERMLNVLHHQQETATRLIKCKLRQMIRARRIPESIVGMDGLTDLPLDTDAKRRAYKLAVRVFGNICFQHIVLCNKIQGLSGGTIKARGTKAGAVRVRFERGPNPAEILVTLLACRDLEDSDRFGKNDVYVIVSVNSATQQTKTIQNGGTNCTFTAEHRNKLTFHNVENLESIVVRVFDEDTGLTDNTDDQLGATEDLIDCQLLYDGMSSVPPMMEPLGQPGWSYEQWYTLRHELHDKNRDILARTKDDERLREMIRLSHHRDSASDVQTTDATKMSGHMVNPLARDTFELESSQSSQKVHTSSAESRKHKTQVKNQLAVKRLDPMFNPRTQFYRVVRTAVVRVGVDVNSAPIRGFLRPGDVVMEMEVLMGA
jgi:hypothetical protein